MEGSGSRERAWEVPRDLPFETKNKELKDPDCKLHTPSVAQAKNLDISFDLSFSLTHTIT